MMHSFTNRREDFLLTHFPRGYARGLRRNLRTGRPLHDQNHKPSSNEVTHCCPRAAALLRLASSLSRPDVSSPFQTQDPSQDRHSQFSPRSLRLSHTQSIVHLPSKPSDAPKRLQATAKASAQRHASFACLSRSLHCMEGGLDAATANCLRSLLVMHFIPTAAPLLPHQ